jgi:hypothetical protein
MKREDIEEAIRTDPRLIPLMTRLLFAAGMNGHDRSLAAMGTAFGDAVRDRDSVDECELMLSSLTDLTDLHADVLLAAAGDPGLAGGKPKIGWRLDEMQERAGLSGRIAGLCVSTLVARGLVRVETDFFGSSAYIVTELGSVLLEVLQQHAANGEAD